jgi:5-methylcytosine-specific restriction endonuclease McrA
MKAAKPVTKRSTPRGKARQKVWETTSGTCHVCGGSLGSKWQVDHVVPVRLGGQSKSNNYLPICGECNRRRWHYRPEVLRLMLRFGIFAKQEIRHDTDLGRELLKLANAKSTLRAAEIRRVFRARKSKHTTK